MTERSHYGIGTGRCQKWNRNVSLLMFIGVSFTSILTSYITSRLYFARGIRVPQEDDDVIKTRLEQINQRLEKIEQLLEKQND